jgi:DNA-binding beta-propeller fold protein YncE
MSTTTTVGQGAHTYTVDKEWGRRAGGVPAFGLISGVATDSQDRVYVFHRAPRAEVMVFDRDGRLLRTWGEGQFRSPHGIWISDRDTLLLVDTETHQVTRWTLDGALIDQWGTHGQPGAPGLPFNKPTYAVMTADNQLYVSDGYGQYRVHRFDRTGARLTSWGEQGARPGQFALPHDVCVDARDRVLVCDRENNRVQIFDRAGAFVAEWTDYLLPMQIRPVGETLYVAEGQQRVSIRTLDNQVLASWGSLGPGPDQFTDHPHSIWVDSRGDIYVTEVTGHNKIEKYVKTGG